MRWLLRQFHSCESRNPVNVYISIPAEAGIQLTCMDNYFVYILANKKYGTLYVGLTDDLSRRIYEHKNKIYEGFTKQYDVKMLVYFEKHLTPEDAMKRESQLKKWKREWKIELIEKDNPDWCDLSVDLPKHLSIIEMLNLLTEKN